MTKNERFQQIWHKYESEDGNKPSSTRDAVDRAIEEGLLEEPYIDPREVLASQMATALREEMQTDRRTNLAAGIALTMPRVLPMAAFNTRLGQHGIGSHEHMERAFAQRREQVIGDLVQLKTDVDGYNDINRGKRPEIQLVLNFADDVAERIEVQKMTPARASSVA